MNVADLFATLGLKPDESSFKKGDKLIENVKRGLEFFIGFEAVKAIGEMVKGTAELADHAVKAAQKLGVTTDAVQELGYAAGLADVNQESLEMSLGKLARNLDEVRQKGTGPAADALRRLGISMSQLNGETLDQNLGVIAERFKAMPDGVAKTALAMDLFGKSGKDMIPLLNEGKNGLVALRNEAEELGVVVDGTTAKAFEKWNDDQRRVHAALQGLKNTVVSALLPTLQDMVTNLLEWVKANREIIASGLKAVVEALIVAFKALGFVVGKMVAVFEFFNEHADLAQAVLIALGAVIASFAIQAAASWLIAFAPVVLLVAAIAGVILVVQDLWRSFKTGKGVAADAWRWIAGKARAFWDTVSGIARGIYDFFADIGGAVKAAFTAVIDWVGDKIKWISDKFDWLKGKARDLRDYITDVLGADVLTKAQQLAQQSPGVTSPGLVGGVLARAQQTTNTTINATVNIDAKNADANQVKQVLDQHLNNMLRDAHAATGGADQGPQ